MYTDIQLEAIKLFGRKDLTEGCYTLEKNGTMWHCGNGEWKKCYNSKGEWGLSSDYGEYMGEILGHIPHLEDLFRVARGRGHGIGLNDDAIEFDEDFLIPYDPTIPLLDQPSLPDIISLFK